VIYMGSTPEVGAWTGNVGMEVFGTMAVACLRPPSWPALSAGSVALPPRKGTVAKTQERKKKGKSVSLKGNKERKLAKMDGKS
jgi:hypothetical protein